MYESFDQAVKAIRQFDGPSDTEVILDYLHELKDGQRLEFNGVSFKVTVIERPDNTPLLSFSDGVAVNPDGYSYEVRFGRNHISLAVFGGPYVIPNHNAELDAWAYAFLNRFNLRVMMSLRPTV